MRLTALTLSRYGIFDSERIVFDPAPGRVNLLVAGNGAGKSILRQAFSDLLFGIHGQSAMGFRFGYQGMKVTAEAIGADGAAFAVVRRKGQGQTLTDAEGTLLDKAVLDRLLGHTDRALLERLFALDTARLRKGGEELLASGGTLADALVAAAGGLSQAREFRRSLETRRDDLAPARRAGTRPFYAALDRLTEAGKQLRAVTVKPEVREKQESDLKRLEAEQLRLNRAAQEASRKIARLERIRRVVGPLAAHDEATGWLLANPAAPILPSDTRERLAEARAALLNKSQLLEREIRNRQALTEQISGIEIDAALIAQAEAIEQLANRASVARQAAADIPRRDAEFAGATQRIGDLLRRLGLSLPIERAVEAIPPQAAVLRARRLSGAYAALHVDLERLPEEIASLERAIDETEAAIRLLPAVDNTAELQRLLGEIRAAGEPGQRADEAARAVAEKEAQLQTALARAPAWKEGADALIALAPQSPEAYLKLARATGDSRLEVEKRAETVGRLQRSKEEDERRLDEIRAARPIADQATIAAARERRDAGWRLIYRRAFTTEPPRSDEEQAWAGDVPLPLAYERSIVAADELADRRNQESERLAEAAELRRRISDAAAEIGSARSARAAAEAVFAGNAAAWQRACEPLGFCQPPDVSDVTALISARDRVISQAAELKSALAGQSSLAARHAQWARLLAAALDCPAREPADLAGLLRQANERIARAGRAERERAGFQATLQTERKTLETRRVEYEKVLRRREKFEADWAVTRAELARPEAEDPEATIGNLDLISDLDKEQTAADAIKIRLREMRAELAEFSGKARGLKEQIAQNLPTDDAFMIGADLSRLLTEQRYQDQRRKTLAAQLRDVEADVATQTEQCRLAEQTLDALLELIGAGTVEAAEERVLAAEERAQRQRLLERAGEALRRDGDGHSFDALRAEAAEIAIDEVEGKKTELADERERTNAEAQAVAGRIATMRAEMGRETEDAGAPAAAATQQAAIATIDHVLDEAVLMQLASLLLQSSLEEVAAAGTSTLLRRIGELFSILTDGAYLRVEADDDPGDGSARLVAVKRDFPDERKTVSVLSEGERDQLFLALRVAAIEEHVATVPPLPFLGDDILQSFDDDRAVAAMRALVTLSNRVQVIILSHHRHLLPLARHLPPDQVHVCSLASAVEGPVPEPRRRADG